MKSSVRATKTWSSIVSVSNSIVWIGGAKESTMLSLCEMERSVSANEGLELGRFSGGEGERTS